MKYRKKPVVIEAVRFEMGREVPVMKFLGIENCHKIKSPILEYENDVAHIVIYDKDLSSLTIKTLEGKMKAKNGDYIIKGVKGEFYPCRKDIFEETYEPV